MANDQVNYRMINRHPCGAEQLFKTMMRLEFALKENGFVRSMNGRKVGVDWNRYAKERLSKEFIASILASDEAVVLAKRPPKHQIIAQGGYLSWEEAGEISSAQELIGALTRVRNNLFHGGKSGDPDNDRNDLLVKNALFVIEAILLNDGDLRTSFEGDY